MLKPRRRRLPLIQLDNVTNWSQECRKDESKNEKVKVKRKRRRKGNAKSRRLVGMSVVLSTVLIAFIWTLDFHFRGPESINLLKRCLRLEFWRNNPLIHLEHRHLYDAVRHSLSANGTQDTVIPSTYGKRSSSLSSLYGSKVMELGCNLTVVFMDPRLATAGPGEAAWFSLESVAAFLPDACILLQTGKLSLVHI